MLKGYQSCQDWKEITKIINNSLRKEGNILWQKDKTSRNVFEIGEMEILEDIGTLKVYLLHPSPNILYDRVAYLKVGFRETIFKVNVINVMGNIVVVELPREVVAKEYRTTPRIKFKPKDAKQVRMGLQLDYVMKSYQSLTFQLIDISETGMGIVVSDENLELVKNCHHLRVEGFGTLDLSFTFLVDMVYGHRLRYRYKGLIRKGNRVGIKFREPLKQSVLDAICMSFEGL